ncbi:MAG: hydroxymethylbilane synthase, partial [Candidatus Hinthialibacter sp.]
MNDTPRLVLGARGSPLSLWQAKRVQTLLHDRCPETRIEIQIIHTTGDKILDKPLVQIGDKGLFTKEIEKALLDGEIDFAVHSFKDLPTQLPEGLAIVSIPERDSPFDALIAKEAARLRDLPENPVVATGSLRRRAQVLAARPDASVVDIRGNVNTRLRKYRESNWDALIMAEAGLRR